MKKEPKLFISLKLEDYELPLTRHIDHLVNSVTNNRFDLSEHLDSRHKLNSRIESDLQNADFYLRILSRNSFNQPWDAVSIQPLVTYLSDKIEVINIVIDDYVDNLIQSQIENFHHYGTWIFLNKNFETDIKKLRSILESKNEESLIKFDLGDSLAPLGIIGVSSQINSKLIEKLLANPEELRYFDRRLFEELIAELFHGFGYEVEVSKKTRDGGRDIVAIQNKEVALKYLIECKRPDPGNPIGIKPIRELFGVKSDEKASKAILATTTYFSPDALKFVERNKWEMETRDFEGIQEWFKQYLSK